MVNMGELFAHPRLSNVPMDRVPLSDSEAERFLLNKGDLLFARQSLVLEGAGKCSIFLSDVEPVTFESHVTRVRLDDQEADPLFYYYYLQSHHGRSAIRSIVEQGAGASGIRGSDLSTLEVFWLPLSKQRAIAHILGTLDDKIELNRRTGQTLEAMARALFRSWFVDFDPVRGKAESRDTGLPQALADLFPDSFEDSELGKIPKGWEVEDVERVAPSVGGSTPSTRKPEFWDGGTIHWTTPKDLSSLSSPVLLDTARKITEAGLAKISSGLLPPGTLLLSSRAPVGYLAIAQVSVAVNQGYIAIPPGGRMNPLWMLFWAEANMERIKARAGGTTFQEISKRNFRPIRLVVPPGAVARRFDEAVKPIFARIVTAERDSRALAALRDVLLPKLISGALRVPATLIDRVLNSQ
jgi:type I restriction enzyme S subunit